MTMTTPTPTTTTTMVNIDDTPVSELPTVYKSYTTGDFIIGLAICVGASVANAAGVNLTKLDHVRNEKSGRSPWLRPLWLAGMGLYIASQLVGSTLALEYMRAEYVAPLGEWARTRPDSAAAHAEGPSLQKAGAPADIGLPHHPKPTHNSQDRPA